MLFSITCVVASAVVAQAGLASDPLAKTKHYYKKGGSSDSRGPCPGLNALANHGYLPRSGRKVNLVQAVAGALQGLGVSPETTGLVGAIGFASSTHPLDLSFDLEDLARPGLLIEHDCSMSREDYKIGNNNDYNGTTWGVTLKAFKNKEKMGAFEFGKGKSDRIEDAKKRNPKSAYGPRAAAFGAIEIGMVMSAFGAVGPVKTSWVRSLFEHERLPTHLGWKVSPLSDNAAFALGQGAISLTADSKLIQHLGDVVLSTPQDILSTLEGLLNKGGGNKSGKSGSGGKELFEKLKGVGKKPKGDEKGGKDKGGKYDKGQKGSQGGENGEDGEGGEDGEAGGDGENNKGGGGKDESSTKGIYSKLEDLGGKGSKDSKGEKGTKKEKGDKGNPSDNGDKSGEDNESDNYKKSDKYKRAQLSDRISELLTSYGLDSDMMAEIRRMASEDRVH